MKIYTFKVLKDVAFYMEYGLEGSENLTEEEMEKADKFLESWSYRGLENYEKEEYDNFGRCEVTGVLGNRVKVNFTKIQEESDSDSE
jgi:hypothetical protein